MYVLPVDSSTTHVIVIARSRRVFSVAGTRYALAVLTDRHDGRTFLTTVSTDRRDGCSVYTHQPQCFFRRSVVADRSDGCPLRTSRLNESYYPASAKLVDGPS